MAGGEGSRLRPLTSNTPKPMLPVANTPMMEHIVTLCRRHGLNDVVVTVQYLASVIRTYFGDGADLGVELRYATEETPLGTAGSVGNARDHLDDTFLVISGDALTDIDLGRVVDFHKGHGGPATIVLYEVENPLEFGIVITREDGTVERFLEKPTWGQVFSDAVNTGIYVLDPEIFAHIPPGVPVDFSQDVFPALLEAGTPIHGYVAEGYWEDVGNIEAYLRAHRDVLDGRVDVEVPGFRIAEGVWVGADAEVHPDADIVGPAVIGENCRVEAGAQVLEYSVLGRNVVLGEGGFVQRSVVFDDVYLSGQVHLRGCVVGKGTDIRQGARAEDGVVIGDDCFIGDHAVLNQAVKVYPSKTVESGAIVNSSVVWETRAARTLFGRRGVRGLVNVDVTPELAVRLAMAYGSTLKKGAIVAASRDASRASRTLKRAFASGLNAAGVHVDDLEIAPVPLTRFQARDRAGGFTIRCVDDDPRTVEIRFFADDGSDLDEGAQRKIERNFARQDYRRAYHADIGDIYYPPRAVEFYGQALVEAVDVEAIRARAPKVVADYAFGTASVIMPSILGRLGADVLAVNPFTAERAPVRRPGADLERLGELTRTSGSDFGIVFDTDGERAGLVDDLGRPLDWSVTQLLYVALVAETHPGSRIVVPVSFTQHAEGLAGAWGCEVVRAQTSAAARMVAASAEGGSAALGDRGVILARVLPAFDALAQFAFTLELVSLRVGRISEVVDTLPQTHVVRETVHTPWEQKGAVMRALVERADPARLVLVDGVKRLTDDGWVLVLPDPEEPVCHIWAEAASDVTARRYAAEESARIRRMIG